MLTFSMKSQANRVFSRFEFSRTRSKIRKMRAARAARFLFVKTMCAARAARLFLLMTLPFLLLLSSLTMET